MTFAANSFTKKVGVTLAAGALCLATLGGCSTDEGASGAGDANGAGDAPTATSVDGSADVPATGAGGSTSTASANSIGTFTTQNIEGETITQDIFAEHDLTMVNVFATWCTPCINEMPDLETLHQQMESRGVGVVGIVLDGADEQGNPSMQGISQAKELVQQTGVTYPILVPDPTWLNGRLASIDAIPETFFVDKNGTIVGQSYTGSNSLEGWTQVVESELAAL